MKRHVVNAGTHLYRGSHAEAQNARGYINRSPNYMTRNRPYYFLYNNGNNNNRGKNIANRVYGQVTVYKTRKNLNLANLGSANSVKNLIAKANGNAGLIRAIQKAFRVQPNGSVKRFSRVQYDDQVAKFLCRLGYNGYWAPKLPQKYPGNKHFHQEIVVCKPRTNLKVVRVENATRPPRLNYKPAAPLRTPYTPARRLSYNNNNNGPRTPRNLGHIFGGGLNFSTP